MHNLKFILLLTLTASVCSLRIWKPEQDIEDLFGAKEIRGSCRNGYDTCNLGKEGMINVHIVPHTHDDVG